MQYYDQIGLDILNTFVGYTAFTSAYKTIFQFIVLKSLLNEPRYVCNNINNIHSVNV